ncbi:MULTISPECIES: hypothetical protein [Kytococcus]|uniref:Uncharacterized protein n=1 Tax=Kytococcus schroeteri TaxID=138300 RepID=A0A2I1PAC3_9MICO|nr:MULTISPECIES: hypothetical protein [Kytococcus]OFS15791.1 hypothetical protein HMPREF3099_01125 [Kytococcus sp. HMSC28H12]PKZ41579.1 hypothetical protein CYJ76_06765 [Kytococcus schroeteri]
MGRGGTTFLFLSGALRHAESQQAMRGLHAELDALRADQAVNQHQAAQLAHEQLLEAQRQSDLQARANFAHWRQTPDGQHYLAWQDAALPLLDVARERDAFVRGRVVSAWAEEERTKPVRPPEHYVHGTPQGPRVPRLWIPALVCLVLWIVCIAAAAPYIANDEQELTPLTWALSLGVLFLPGIAILLAAIWGIMLLVSAREMQAHRRYKRQAVAWNAWRSAAHERIGAWTDTPPQWTADATRDDAYLARVNQLVDSAAELLPPPESLPDLYLPEIGERYVAGTVAHQAVLDLAALAEKQRATTREALDEIARLGHEHGVYEDDV